MLKTGATGDIIEQLDARRIEEALSDSSRDETFLRYEYTRGKLELRGLSRPFSPAKPECSLLRLRSLFGASAGAEIVLYLLTHDDGHPSHIARLNA